VRVVDVRVVDVTVVGSAGAAVVGGAVVVGADVVVVPEHAARVSVAASAGRNGRRFTGTSWLADVSGV